MESFNRFKRDIFVAILCFAVLLGGCAYFSPSAKQTRAEVKVEKTKEAIFTSEEEILKEAKGYIYGASYALDLNPNPNQFTITAKTMTSKAISAIGPPDISDMVKMTAIIEGLVSTNKSIVAKAELMLRDKDNIIINLQEGVRELNIKLKNSESKFIEVSRESASLAQKWWTLKQIFWWGVYIFIAFIVCKFLVVLVPPPYNSIFGIFEYIIGGFIRMVFKLLPKAKETAKVVSSDVQVALNHVVTSIQETKTKVSAKNEQSGTKSMELEQLKAELSNNTDTISRNVIDETKKNLGYI